MKRIVLFLTVAITAFFCVTVHGQTQPTGQPQRVQHPYYQYDGFVEAKGGLLLSRRVANFTPKLPALIYDTATGKIAFYTNAWNSIQNVAYTADYTDLVNRPDLTQYVPSSRTVNGYALTTNVTINKVDIGLGNVQNVDATNAINISAGTLPDARLSANVTMQGNTFNGANQLLQLDAGGKVAYANLPAALMIYKGVWDASTNNPTLVNGTGVNGWVYRVHPGGTVNFGAGDITFSSGDYVIYNGSVWQKSGGGDAVTSVNGQQGVVVLSTANIAEGGTNYYYTNARVQSFADTRYSLLNHEHVYSDIANLGSYTGFDVRYKSISYVPAWSDVTSKPTFATVATSGAYNDLSGRPTLGTLAALSSIGNTYITDVAWSKVTGAPSFLTTETDPTIYSWAKASVKPSYTYAEIGGTVPTWNQNTAGNAATATTATNWGIAGNYAGLYSSGTLQYLMIYNQSTSDWEASTASPVQSFIGLNTSNWVDISSTQTISGQKTFSSYINQNTSSPAWGGAFGNNAINLLAGSLASVNGTDFRIFTNLFYDGAVYKLRNTGYGSFITFDGGEFSYYTTAYGTAGSSPALSNAFNIDRAGAVAASSFSGAATGLTGVATGLTAQRSRELVSLGSYLWSVSSLPTAYNDAITMSFVQPADGWQGYGTVLTAKTYTAGGGTLQMYVPYSPSTGGTGLQVRFGNYDVSSGNSWTSWKTLLASDNYNSYAPTLTGTGASGTWGISITGSAGSVAWTNVTGRPTALSQFSNDAGYITSAVTSIAGTSNQIAVSAATGSVTVSLTNNVVIPGTITSSASYESSDRRLKTELTGTRLTGLIQSLQARLYEKDGRVEYGYYAQEALTIIPTAVKKRIDGYYDLSYTQVFVVKIASLEKRVMELETLLQKIYSK